MPVTTIVVLQHLQALIILVTIISQVTSGSNDGEIIAVANVIQKSFTDYLYCCKYSGTVDLSNCKKVSPSKVPKYYVVNRFSASVFKTIIIVCVQIHS